MLSESLAFLIVTLRNGPYKWEEDVPTTCEGCEPAEHSTVRNKTEPWVGICASLCNFLRLSVFISLIFLRTDVRRCFLLTPKLLPDLEYSDACSILNIMNGPWIEEPSKGNIISTQGRGAHLQFVSNLTFYIPLHSVLQCGAVVNHGEQLWAWLARPSLHLSQEPHLLYHITLAGIGAALLVVEQQLFVLFIYLQWLKFIILEIIQTRIADKVLIPSWPKVLYLFHINDASSCQFCNECSLSLLS